MIKIEKNSYKLLKKIKDPKFNIDELENYSLSIQLGVRDFQVFIFDNKNKRALLLEDYIFESEHDIQTRLKILKHLFDNHHLLLAGFWRNVSVLIKNRKFAVVPENFYQKEYNISYLSLNATFHPEKELCHSIVHQKAALVSVFALNKEVHQFFEDIYPNKKVRYLHQSSPLINGALKNGDDHQRKLILYVDRFLLHIIVVSEQGLGYYNQFPIKKMDDYIRYLKLVASELKIDLGSEKTVVYGFLGKHTPHFKFFSQNVKNIRLGGRPRGIAFGYVFDEIQDHQYFDLYSLYTA